MAKKTAGATATPGAGLAARPRGERPPVTTRDLQALPYATLCLADARQRMRPR